MSRPLSGCRVDEAADEVIQALSQLELPGNVRQLENLIYEALLNKEEDGPLLLSDLPLSVWQLLAETSAEAPPPSEAEPWRVDSLVTSSSEALPRELDSSLAEAPAPLTQTLKSLERLLLQRTLKQTHGNQAKAAQLLGITPRSVYNKLRKYRLLT